MTPIRTPTPRRDLETVPYSSPSDTIRQVDEEGNEYWSARELMARFGYAHWAHVRDGNSRAKAAITNTLGETAAQDHIAPGVCMVDLGSGATRQVDDFRLTRYGTYMWAMNGDPRKPAVAPAAFLAAIAEELNTRPRACLGFYTPQEVFHKLLLEGGSADEEGVASTN